MNQRQTHPLLDFQTDPRHGGAVLFWETFVAFSLDPARICGLLWVNTGELIQLVLSGQLADMVRSAAAFETKPLLQSRVPFKFVAFHRSVEYESDAGTLILRIYLHSSGSTNLDLLPSWRNIPPRPST